MRSKGRLFPEIALGLDGLDVPQMPRRRPAGPCCRMMRTSRALKSATQTLFGEARSQWMNPLD